MKGIKKKSILAFGAIMIGVIFLTGCSSISTGRVTAKEHTASYQYTVMICASYGKYGCTVWMPIVDTAPEEWKLELKNGTDTGAVSVNKQTWNDIHVGDVYNGGK